jgi:hypothetical protein
MRKLKIHSCYLTIHSNQLKEELFETLKLIGEPCSKNIRKIQSILPFAFVLK